MRFRKELYSAVEELDYPFALHIQLRHESTTHSHTEHGRVKEYPWRIA
jgi:hypothetical protein